MVFRCSHFRLSIACPSCRLARESPSDRGRRYGWGFYQGDSNSFRSQRRSCELARQEPTLTFVLALLVLLTIVGPGPRLASGQTTHAAVPRYWPKTRWNLEGRLTAGVTREFRIPVAFGVEDSTIFTVEGNDGHLRAYSLSGDLLWGTSRANEHLDVATSGPLEIAPDGTVWTIDRRGRRAVGVEPVSHRTSAIFVSHPLLCIAPLSRDRFLLIDLADSIVMVDARGRPTKWLTEPTEIRSAMPLARESFASVAPNGTAIIAFRWSGALLLLGPKEQTLRTIESIETRPYPPAITTLVTTPSGKVPITRIDPSAQETIVAVAIDNARVYVVVSDSSAAHVGSTLDTYDEVTGRYLASYHLPYATNEIAVRSRTLYLLAFTPGANLTAWTLPSKPILLKK
jgi:hypothetical protein